MYKKFNLLLLSCDICGERVHFKTLKNCQRCRKNICILCTQHIEPYEPWTPLKAKQFMRSKLFDNPACPQCYEEIKQENEEKRAEEEAIEKEQNRISRELYRDCEED